MNILILGLGSIGRRHARTLQRLQPDAKIFALRSGKGSGGEEGVTDVRVIADVPQPIDLAIVSTPTYLHRTSVEQVLPLKPFLMLEKPLALTTKEGKKIVAAIESAGVRNYMACHLRFHPCVQWLRKELKKGTQRIRSVHATCTSWLPDWQKDRDYHESFRASAAKSGGVHLELIHELDYVTWLFEMPQSKMLKLQSVPELDIDAPGIAHYDLGYPSFGATIDLSYASRETERTLEIAFDDSQWTADLLAFTIRDERSTVLFQSDSTIDDVYDAQMRHVLGCVQKNESSMHSVDQAIQILQLALP